MSTTRQLAKTYLPTPNFIIIHYCYIIGMAILGSGLMYSLRNVSYINALLFACGMATQSGLNPIDLKELKLFQQIVIFLIPFFTNPIVINTAVVYVRMYWFRERFRDIVEEAKKKAKSARTLSTGRAADVEREGRGVGGRTITVLHTSGALPPNRPTGAALPPYNTPTPPMSSSPFISRDPSSEREKSDADVKEKTDTVEAVNGASNNNNADTNNIQFEERPHPRRLGSADQHISFAANVRPAKDAKDKDATLRIPSPREYERGGVPTSVEDEEEDTFSLKRGVTTGAMPGEPLRPVVSLPHNGGRQPNTTSQRAVTIERSSGVADSGMRQRRNPLGLMSAQTIESVVNRVKRLRDESPASRISRSKSFVDQDPKPYLSYTPTVGRNSAFVDLTDEQRDELGGIEYRSLRTLSYILLGYFFLWHIFGLIIHIAAIMKHQYYGELLDSQDIGRPWWAVFTSASSFHDLGFTLTPNSMISFQKSEYFLIFGAFLIIIGNTAFPCLLRLIIWIGFKIAPEGSAVRENLHFLLDHPRRCFTLLFPSKPTWVLFAILIALNGIDTILFIVLDFGNKEVINMHNGERFVAGLYQAAATRTAGFSCVNLAALHPAVQVSYMVMMYISVFPIAISVRRTNVYEERSLGIYSGDFEDESKDPTKEPSYVGAHLRKQLSFDLWYIVLGLFIICIAEGGKLADKSKPDFNTFAILFEVISAYGTVGLSLGYPGTDTSFCAQFGVISKLVICAMMIRGRHRGLPYELDRAILLPSKSLHHKEEAYAKRMLERRMSNLSQVLGGERERPKFGPATTEERRNVLTNPEFENAITISSMP